jgi:hypothetical protein
MLKQGGYLSESRREVRQREFSISSIYRGARTPDGRVAYLRLSGRWLEQLGFARGSRVLVTAEQGKLVVTLAPAVVSVGGARRGKRPAAKKRPPYLVLAALRRRAFAEVLQQPPARKDGRGCDRPD